MYDEDPFTDMPYDEREEDKKETLYPGRFEEISRDCKDVINQMELFDGFRFDLQRNFNNHFGIIHSMGLGSMVEGANYNFGANYYYNGALLTGRIDTDFQLQGKYFQDLTENLQLRAQALASMEPNSSACHFDLEYKGEDYWSQVKWSPPTTFGFSFLQSVTPNLALGCDALYSDEQSASVVTLGGKWTGKKLIIHPNGEKEERDTSTTTALITPGHQFIASYTQNLAPHLKLATELLFQNSQNGLESMWIGGFEYKFMITRFRTNIDSTGHLTVFMEEGLNLGSKLALCADLDYGAKQYRVGFGLSMMI